MFKDLNDEIYFRLYENDEGRHVVTIQWFDEHDYDQDRFLNALKYASEEEAQEALKEIE